MLRLRVREQRSQCKPIFVSLMTTIFLIYVYLFSYPRHFSWMKKAMSSECHFCISNVNYFGFIFLLIFESASFFVNEESHEQCISNTTCSSAAVLNEQQFVNEWLLILARKICSDSVHHTPSCGNQNIRL